MLITYNKEIAMAVAKKIIGEYYDEFITLEKKLNQLKNKKI